MNLSALVTLDGVELDLTPKEYELLFLLASYTGRAFSREFLLQHLWGYDYDGFDRTVDTDMWREASHERTAQGSGVSSFAACHPSLRSGSGEPALELQSPRSGGQALSSNVCRRYPYDALAKKAGDGW